MTDKQQARESLQGVAQSAGRQGRPLDVAWTLAGLGVEAGVGERWPLYRDLAREWALGRLGWLETERWQAIADADWFDYHAQRTAGL